MPRSYWLPIVAAVGLILAGSVEGKGIADQTGSHGGAGQAANTSSNSVPTTLPASVQPDIKRIASALEKEAGKTPSDYDRRNVEAQEKVAWWTPWLAVVTTLEMLITLAGVVLVGFTLYHTRRAADASQQSADVAKRALTDLERPFVYARITLNGMERTKSVYEHRWRLNTGKFRIEFINFGNTPAELTRLQYEIIPRKRNTGIVDYFSPKEIGGRELPIGSVSAKDSPYGENTDLSENQLIQTHGDAIANGEESVWVTGFVRYRDIFGANRITGFTFLLNQDTQWEFIGKGDNENYNYAREENPQEIPTGRAE